MHSDRTQSHMLLEYLWEGQSLPTYAKEATKIQRQDGVREVNWGGAMWKKVVAGWEKGRLGLGREWIRWQ